MCIISKSTNALCSTAKKNTGMEVWLFMQVISGCFCINSCTDWSVRNSNITLHNLPLLTCSLWMWLHAVQWLVACMQHRSVNVFSSRWHGQTSRLLGRWNLMWNKRRTKRNEGMDWMPEKKSLRATVTSRTTYIVCSRVCETVQLVLEGKFQNNPGPI